MTRDELIKNARDLHATHGLLPVPVAGKVPIGGTGWNLLPLETRLLYVASDACTGVGIQGGLVFHPYLGPRDAKLLDCDINDAAPRNLFAGTLQKYFIANQWRWGRRPAMLVFTEPGGIKREKFGPVQLLGNGKQCVFFGAYQNKTPLPTDPPNYWHEGPSIFDVLPPDVPAATLKAAVEASLAAAGIPIAEQHAIDATPLSASDIASLNPESFAQFEREIKSMLFDIERMPTGSGRGDKLYNTALKYGALIKASGTAPMLVDSAREICPADKLVEYEIIKKHAFLSDVGKVAEETYSALTGTLGAGDRRDFARGIGMSMGLGQQTAVAKQKHALIMPSGRQYAGQTASDLMKEDLPPLRFLINRYLSDSGCVVLAGKPKVGKGWIILDMALAVAEGSEFWGEPCEQGDVLMYMLEDSKRRVRERIGIMRPNGSIATDRLRFRYSVDGPFYINADGTGSLLEDILEHIKHFPHIRLIVIDVLQRIRGTVERSDNAYQVDYKVIGALQKLSAERGVAIIVVHHTKKGKVDDAIDSINGSFGVIGAADGGIVIGREGDVMRANSMMRDIPDFEFELTKEDGNPMWKPAQLASEILAPSEGTKTAGVLLALHSAACELIAGDVAKRAHITEGNAATYLGRLVKSNQAIKLSRGHFMAAGLPIRERVEGIKDVLRRCERIPVTHDVEMRYAPKGAPEGASFVILYDKAIAEIDANFSNSKKALDALRHRGLIYYNSDTVWLIGSEWGMQQHQTVHANPFALKMPWELTQ